MDHAFGRRDLLATAATVATGVAVAGCSTPRAAGPSGFEEGFEGGLDDWDAAGHVGSDAGGEFQWQVEATDERTRGGDRSTAIFTEGRFDDGTAWLVRPVSLEAGRRHRFRGSAYYYSETESFNVTRHAVLYLGPERPDAEGDFPPPDTNSTDDDTAVGGLREPLDRAAGWNEYAFEWAPGDPAPSTLYFAVGTSVVWETDRTDFVDDVRLRVDPS